MMDRSNLSDIKEYCLQFYRELNHPCSLGKKVPINISDLEMAVDVLDGILGIESREKSFRGLQDQFYAAFRDYLQLPRSKIGSLCIAADKLSALIEPFLKKVALHFLPSKKIVTENGTKLPLWKTSNYADILEALELIKKSKIHIKTKDYWEKKPAYLAILRYGFTARQKGVHESRIHSLEELEKIIYSTIGSYIIVCLRILKIKPLFKKLYVTIQRHRAVHLFEERVRSYPITGTLLSRKEHLLIYKWRKEISPDVDGKKLLFISYLTGSGPCFYWFKEEDKNIMLAWTKELLATSEDEIIKENAIRYLVENSPTPLKLQELITNLAYYENKEELSEYIRQFGKSSDMPILLKLCSDKREEVALVSQELLSHMFPKINEILKKVARSKSPVKRKLLRMVIRNLAQESDIGLYRSFANIRDKADQIIYIHCLGELGEDEDLRSLSNWVTTKRRNGILRTACWYSISRIANRLGMSSQVWSLVNKRDRIDKLAALEAMSRNGIGTNFKSLFSKQFINRFHLADIILEIASPGDNRIIRSYLAKARLDYDVRDIVLALCKIGDADDFKFLLNLFCKYKGKIEFQNHVRIADGMARICNKKQSRSLGKFVNSSEFWSYISSGNKRAKRPLPVKNIDNQAFMRRVIAACFIGKTTRKDVDILRKLLNHNYKWIAYKAAVRFAKVGYVCDLDNLTRSAWNLDQEKLKEANATMHALCLLDKKLYRHNRVWYK
jgi:hypothetical protein